MITRRNAMKAGVALTGAVGGAGLLLPALGGEAQARTTTDIDPTTIPKFAQEMTVPQVLRPDRISGTTSYYSFEMQEVQTEIIPGKQTTVRTFDGHWPGPWIKACSGHRVVVTQKNNLPTPTSIHLHGGHVPESSDGTPMDLIQPGGEKTYTYPNSQPNANLWFHDHAHHIESENVFRGLTGIYTLMDLPEKALGLPSGAYDVPISIRDARFDENGQFIYQMNDFRGRNVILANGKAWPYFEVAARKYRFRLYNTANMRFFTLKLSDGSTVQQIGTDGGLLEAPVTTDTISLTSGERADVVIDFSKYPVGTTLQIVNTENVPAGVPPTPVLQFRVTRKAADYSRVPAKLRTLPALAVPTVNRDIVLRVDENIADGMGYIDDKVYDHNRVDTTIKYGDTEVWTVSNVNQRVPHNFHIHLVQFRVLERNGVPVTSGPEAGLKDTVRLMPGEKVKVQATFTGYRGKYVYHCHMFDHASMGMMATMEVV
ncbi:MULTISPECIES: multicopper oxidase family protein [unclassified Streptomyces]|uniref:multicopper oxidase family protein n=1 Tax=unclassified Streptomyces TaxID=2593676 RepID=UPI0033E23D81